MSTAATEASPLMRSLTLEGTLVIILADSNIKKEAAMDADYTEYEYLPECKDGCGALTDWMPSNEAAHAVAHNHAGQTGHEWRVQQRMKEPQG